MQTTKQTDEKIREAVQGFGRRSVTATSGRNHSIRFRVSARESREIKQRARRLNISVSALLRQLFEHAKEQL